MQKTRFAAIAAVGLAAAIAIPTIAFGNARRDTGSMNFLKAAHTPYLASLLGSNEVGGGDPDGTGTAAITIDITDATSNTDGATVCWDLVYSAIATPTAAHIHSGVTGNIVVPFTGATFTTSGSTGCADIGLATGETVGGGILATEIVADPTAFYVNVHNADFAAGAIRGQLAAGPPPAGEAHLLPTPLRAYDSRDAAGPKIQPGQTRTISLATGHLLNSTAKVIAVPPGATAAIITLTIADTDLPGGFLTIYNADSPQPATSSINWKAAAQDVAVSTQVAVNAAGEVKVTDGAGTAPTHFIIDVIGYMF